MKTKKQGPKSPTTSTKPIVGHPGASITDAIKAVKDAANALYDAVLVLPFNLEDPLPNHNGDTDAYIERCRAWHNDVISRFNEVVGKCGTGIGVSMRDAFPLSAIMGQPEFGDASYASDGPPFLDFAQRCMASFENRCKQEDEHYLKVWRKSVPNAKSGTEPRAVRDHQARRFVLDLQYRSRALTRWVFDAIERLAELTLPRITIIDGGTRSQVARVELAGAMRERPISQEYFDLLVELSNMKNTDFGDRAVKSKLLKAVPELAGLIQVVDASEGNAWYRLDPRMAGRIMRAAT